MKRICIGKIVDAHGVKGLVKILPFGEDVSLLDGILFTSEKHEKTLKLTLKNALGKYRLAEIEGIHDRTQAENLKNVDLYIDRDALPETNQGQYYHTDLIGLEVMDAKNQNIGHIIAVENFGAGDLLDIKTRSSSFYLPFSFDYIKSIEEKKITIQNYEDFL